MGGKQSTVAHEATSSSRDSKSSGSSDDDWGTPPDEVPANERDVNELVLQSWAFCKAKPSPARAYRSDVDERQRRKQVAWRKRASFIELDCGDDSFFVANNYKVIGVADGVGGWADEGVDSSLFANALMRNAKWYAETHRDERDPQVILQHAYDKLVRDKTVTAGSSTACVATLRSNPDDGTHVLDVANLGDSGALVVRNRDVHLRVHEKVHGFNAPFQLAVLPSHLRGRAFSDRVSDCVRESVAVQEGDVVLLGTDGLFDNRFNVQLAADAGWVGATEEHVLARVPLIGFWLSGFLTDDRVDYVDPYRVAQRLVHDAYAVASRSDGPSPWAAMLRQYGVADAQGGKMDDITVLLSRVSTREALKNSAVW